MVKHHQWPDVGYHFLVHPDGTLYEGRMAIYKGAHTGGANTRKLGILMMGDYATQWWDIDDDVTDKLLATALRVIQAAKAVFPSLKALGGHRDYGTTDTVCPGELIYDKLADLRKQTSLAGP